MTTSFSFGCEGSDGVDERCSCEDRRGLCDQVATEGNRRIGNGHSSPGSVQRGSMRGRMVLLMWRSEGEGDKVLGGRGIHRDDGRCLRGRFLVQI